MMKSSTSLQVRSHYTIIPPCTESPLPNATISSIFLLKEILLTKSKELLVFLCPLYLVFVPNTALTLPSPLVAVLANFHPPMTNMPFTLSLLARLKMLLRSPKPCRILPISHSHPKLSAEHFETLD
jgi:hypothetical protein